MYPVRLLVAGGAKLLHIFRRGESCEGEERALKQHGMAFHPLAGRNQEESRPARTLELLVLVENALNPSTQKLAEAGRC